jgi:hypothetical protein
MRSTAHMAREAFGTGPGERLPLLVNPAVPANAEPVSRSSQAAAQAGISSSRFGATSWFRLVTPVTLPPGRFRLATSPTSTGSAPVPKTIGISRVAGYA